MGATPILYQSRAVEDYVKDLTGGEGFDTVFDTVGGANIPISWQAAKAGGHVVSCQSNSEQNLAPLHLKALTHSAVLMLLPLLTGKGRAHHGAILREVAHLVDAGQLTPLIDDTDFALEDVAEAHRRVESGAAIGKVVLQVAEEGGA